MKGETTLNRRKGQNEMPMMLVFFILALLGFIIFVIMALKGKDLFRNLFGT